MKTFWFISLVLFAFGLNAQITIHLVSIPASTPEGDPIFFAGDLNGWDPVDPAFQLEIRDDNEYWIDLPSGSGTIEFKFTRGSWEKVEGDENGNFRPNRTHTYGNGDTLHLTIQGWEDLDIGGMNGNSTANENVIILDSAMYMPQLERFRRIWVYLPSDYDTSTKFYRVLYMHDGQNVFDASTSFISEWEVDETLTQMESEGVETAIVVAIDNGQSHRIDEYSPFVNPQYGGGEGDKYLDFIIETLKPRIDSTYRILDGPEYTGIIGSSMGGLISHYGHFRNPEVFGRAGIFSPAYWFSDEYFSYTKEKGKQGDPRLYLLAGEMEGNFAETTQEMYDTLQDLDFTDENVFVKIPPDGEHSEWFWAREFEEAFNWLFNPELVSISKTESLLDVKISPNPATDSIDICCDGRIDVQVYSYTGAFLYRASIIDQGKIDLSFLHGSQQLVILVKQGNKSNTYRIIKK